MKPITQVMLSRTSSQSSGQQELQPRILEFWTALNQQGGVARARQLYDQATSRDVNVVLFQETETNLLGYQRLQTGNVNDAIALFHLIAEAYPRSANVYDSLSDAYLAGATRTTH